MKDNVCEHCGTDPAHEAGDSHTAEACREYLKAACGGYRATIACFEAELAELRDDRKRALKRADALTLDTQTCEEAVTSLVSMTHSARAANERLEAELAEAKDDVTRATRELETARGRIGVCCPTEKEKSS